MAVLVPLVVSAELAETGAGTRERAAGIAERMPDAGDRFLFAARCGRRELLAAWGRDEALMRRVNSAALMLAVRALRNDVDQPPDEGESQAVLAMGRGMARRLELNPLDLMRCLREFRQHAPPVMRAEMRARPVGPMLAEVLGLSLDSEDQALADVEKSRHTPHGILTSEGRLLTVSPEVPGVFAEKKLSISRLLEPERLLCYTPEKGGTPVLDRSSGSVKLEFLAESPPYGGFQPEFNDLRILSAEDIVYQPPPANSGLPRPAWRLPLRSSETWLLPSGMILAFDEDAALLALLKPLPGNLKPLSP